jgi:ClpP class serine protease
MGNTAYRYVTSHMWAILESSLGIILDVSLGHGEQLEALEARLGKKLDNAQTATYRTASDGKLIATLPIHGPIFRYANLFTEISGATSNEIAARDFTAAMENPKVKAIILDIDSPGGEVNGTNAMASMIYAARGIKPVVAFSGHMAASAAYWIASAADRIVVDATASVGSIGVVLSVSKDKPETGEHKFISSASPLKHADPGSKEGAESLQSYVDELAQVFVESVARNMGVTPETVLKDFGRGGVKVAAAAVSSGMAHAIGSYEEVLSELMSSKRKITSIGGRNAAQGANYMENEKTEAQTVDSTDIAATLAELQASNAALTAQLKAEMQSRRDAEAVAKAQAELAAAKVRHSEAIAFADGLVKENKISPSVAVFAVALHEAVAALDGKFTVSSDTSDGNFEVTALEALLGLAEGIKADSTDLGSEVVAAAFNAKGATILNNNAKSADEVDADAFIARMNAERGHKAKVA